MKSCIISDSACLIALDRIGHLELIKKLYYPIYIPDAVYKEFGKTIDWLEIRSIKTPNIVKTLGTQLGSGESEVIALGLEIANSTLILDDKKARRIAGDLGLSLIGTIGILLKAKAEGHLNEIKSLLDALNLADFRISDSLYQRDLILSGEQ